MKRIYLFLFALALSTGYATAQQDSTVTVTEQVHNNKSEIAFEAQRNVSDQEYNSIFSDVQRELTFINRIDLIENNVYIYCNSNVSFAQVAQLMREFSITKYTYHPNLEGGEMSKADSEE